MPKDENQGRIIAGRYRLRCILGAGAHGTVHLAEDLGRGCVPVAVKLVEAIVGGSREEPADEILRHFRHPNWAAVLDAGPHGPEGWFQILERVPGASLDSLEGPQSLDRVWALLEDGARVLGALHRLGVLHYDITPGNFMLDDSGASPRFVLTDGGLAHVGPVTGVARGSPQTMAPEVTEAGEHDHRADLYALGLVAYRLATGRDPIEGRGGEVLGRRRREAAPRARTFRDDLPPALDDLLGALLSRDPKKRPHDAFALLDDLAEAKGSAVPRFRHEEGLAAAEGGALVGGTDTLARFRTALEPLRARRAGGGGRLAAARAPSLGDPVLVLRGRPSSGTSRLAAEALAHARAQDIPALLLSGRDATAERRGPLRLLLDGMAALDVGPDDVVVPLRLGRSTRRNLGREERSHAQTRVAEQFVNAVQHTAARTPFVLVVQDFAELADDTQEALRILSRHLLALRENGGSVSAPPVVLILDVGDAEVESLVVPDAREPERPFLATPSLDRDEVLRFLSARFPGLAPEPVDLDRVLGVSEGLPGALTALLAEGSRRGDLRYESGRWCWNVDRLDRYQILTGLSPRLTDALRNADAELQILLHYLSLVECPLPESVVHELWAQHSEAPLPTTPLIRTLVRDDETHYALAARAVGLMISPEGSGSGARRRALLQALGDHQGWTAATECARLAIALGRGRSAVQHLLRTWPESPDTARMASQGLVRQALDLDRGLLNEKASRLELTLLLEYGPDAAYVANLLAASSGTPPDDLETGLRIVDVLTQARREEEAVGLLRRLSHTPALNPEQEASLLVRLSQLLLKMQREDEGRTTLAAARGILRPLRGRSLLSSRTYARFLMTSAQLLFLGEAPHRALLFLRAARCCARQVRSPGLLARINSNMGIVEQQLGQAKNAARHLERALRIRRSLGDVDGILATLVNLGRLHQKTGSLVKSAAVFQDALSRALRYRQATLVGTALSFLAQVYDQQMNSRLAASTLQRAVQASTSAGFSRGAVQAAWQLAPLAAALGDLGTTREMLLVSATAAKAALTTYARAGHHLAAALAALHAGDDRRAAVCFERALRHHDCLYEANRATLAHLARFLTSIGVRATALPVARPHHDGLARFSLRTGLWFERAVGDNRTYRSPPVERFLPRRNTDHVASGTDRRLLAEATIRAASKLDTVHAQDALASVEHYLALTGERFIQGRALAVHSTLLATADATQAAQLFSRSIQLIDTQLDESLARRHPLPQEHAHAHRHHAEALGEESRATRLHTADSHALAHRLLLKHGFTSAPDERVASALRRVLAATTRMNAGAGLDDLLQGMTNDTIEITGAERACVVLLDSDSSQTMRVEKGASSEDLGVEVEDLSQTVIQRVIEARAALLLHDVFDDQELMGRPSITSLSLRSILCVPMLRGETLFGVLYADSASAAGSFDQVDQEVLSLFAEQAAAALDTHRLVSDVQNSMSELKAMQERLVRGERLRTMGELSSGVAHEFNNLLTSILARVQLISLDPVSPELKRDLDLIEKACMDAAAVVRRLQSFTRKEREGGFEQLNLAEICNDAVEYLRPLWSTRRRHGRPPVTVKLHSDAQLLVDGDATELREVVTNLLKNSLEALPDGGHIEIEARGRDGGVVLRVEDDGPGIPEDIQTRIFDPFFTTKGERGTGLGLCLSQQIVERHGGEIALWSELGQGTRFTIELPLSAVVCEEDETEEAETPEEPAPLRVLVVDDDENVLGPLCRFLERSGYALESASDGAEGLAVAGRFAPDVIISDVAMPTMNGIELCREVRRERPELPVILMSGWTSGVDPSRARRAGATALLKKPFALEQVASALRTIARERNQARA